MKFKSDIEVQAGLKDSAGNAGTSGQVLSTSGTSVSWVDPALLPADSAENLITEVYNETGATLTKGTVVYINGGHGNLPTITKALATSDATSAQTYGVVRADITNNNNGWAVVTGRLEDLDTQAYSPGTVLYLSSTTAGQWTSTKQYAPNHLVYVGIVVRSHPTQGIVEVKIQNGYELDELHNVAAQTPSNNDGIFYNTSSSLWEAKSISAAGGQAQLSGTGFVKASGTTISYDNTTYYPYPTGTTSQYVRGDGSLATFPTIPATPTLDQVLTAGNTSLIAANAGTLGVWDNVNSGYMQIRAIDNSFLFEDSAANKILSAEQGIFSIYKSGTITANLYTTLLTASRDYNFPNASGTLALTSDISGFISGSGTTNYVPKFTSSSAIGDSLIYDNGTNAIVGSTSNSGLGNVKLLVKQSGTLDYEGLSVVSSSNDNFISASHTGSIARLSSSYGNTGSYTPLALTTSGIDRIYVTTGGNVGIGTNSPNVELSLYQASTPRFHLQNSTSGVGSTSGFQIALSSTDAYLWNFQNGASIFATNNTERMRITSAGNVGIGTTNPVQSLDVNGLIRSNRTSNTDGALVLGTTGTLLYAADSGGYLASYTANTERMRITSAGNVGIGTASPLFTTSGRTVLDVNGSSSSLISLSVGGVAGSYLYQVSGNLNITNDSNGSIINYTGGLERMRITSAGNVGIGTSSPAAKLDVTGDALINGVTVGRGSGNQSSNTVLGNAAFINNSSGFGCVVIGTGNSYPPSGNVVDFNNTLSISKGSSAVGDGWPHIWAPDDVSTTSTVEVIAAEGGSYAAMFVEYVIQDGSGNMRGGYIKGIWSSDLSTLKMTEETTSSIGVTTDYVFDLVDNGSNSAALQLTSISGNSIYCAVSSRLLTRPY